MKSLGLSIVVLLFWAQGAGAQECPILSLQSDYKIKEKILSIGHDFEITSGLQNVGSIRQRVFNWGKTFEMMNEADQLVARAEARIFSIGSKVDIYDCVGRLIGSVQENVLKSLFKVHTVYSVFNPNGEKIGQSKKLDWVGTDITYYSVSGHPMAQMSRPWINWFVDTWTISFNSTQVDPRLFFFAAAYKTAVDADRRQQL